MSAPESFTRSRLLDFQQSTLGDRNGRPCGIYHVVLQVNGVYGPVQVHPQESQRVALLLARDPDARAILAATPFPKRPGVTYILGSGAPGGFTNPAGYTGIVQLGRCTARWNETVPLTLISGSTTVTDNFRATVYSPYTNGSSGGLRRYAFNPNVFDFLSLSGEALVAQTNGTVVWVKTLHVFATTNPAFNSSVGHSRPRPSFGRCCVFDVTSVPEKGPGDVQALYTFRECAIEGVEAASVTLGRIAVTNRLAMMPPPLELRVSPNEHWESSDVWPGNLSGEIDPGRIQPYTRSRVLHAANFPQSVLPPCCNIA